MDSVVYQKKNSRAEDGHTVRFDFDGNLAARAIADRETAYGKGKDKVKFSDLITVRRYRIPVNNGDKFDGKDIGDLSINEHSDSRRRLADLYIRWKDQALFDAAQGLRNQSSSHVINLGSTFGYDELVDIERKVKTGIGYDTGGIRRPLNPYRMDSGRACWLFVVDPYMASVLRKNDDFKTLSAQGDNRGDGNRVFNGIIGKIGQLLVMEADLFKGETIGATQAANVQPNILLDKSSVEISGLRQRDQNGAWTGQDGFVGDFDAAGDVSTGDLFSRGLILGTGALQLAYGKEPDYKFKTSQDFEITSESAVEFWIDMRKTKLVAEGEDYEMAKVANQDYGVITVDMQVR